MVKNVTKNYRQVGGGGKNSILNRTVREDLREDDTEKKT